MKNTGKICINYGGVLKEAIGREGITAAALSKSASGVKKAVEKVSARRRSGEVGFADLPYDNGNARAIKKTAEHLRGSFEYLVVLGIGGSALGPRALIDALTPAFYNLRSGSDREGWLKVIIADNISPEFIKGIFDVVPLTKTVFNVITKSGSTSETLSCFAAAVKILKKRFGADWNRRVIVTTDPEKGFLRKFASENKLKSFPIPPNVGGRFSVLSSVGLLPAACAGIDIMQLLKGAASAEKFCFEKDLFKNPAGVFASVHRLFYRAGRRINVFMPYSERLGTVSDWFAQLWAESLGKKYDLKGRKVFTGPTPVKAKGVTDQHSQLQLYTEGPQDKVITILSVQKQKSLKIPKMGDFVFGGRDMSELFRAEETGTRMSLKQAKRPVMTMTMPDVTAFYLGQLFMVLETAAAIYGEMAGINTFDQPGVEYGKIIAKKILAGKMPPRQLNLPKKYSV